MKKVLAVLLLTLALGSYLWIESGETFVSEYNLKNLARHTAFLSILAIGEALVIITAGIDLSVGSIVGLSALLMAHLMSERGFGAPTAVLCVVGIMACVGLAQGQMVVRLRVQPFIATLAGMMILRGSAKMMTGGASRGFGKEKHAAFLDLGQEVILGIVPVQVAIMLVVAGIFTFVMHFTVFGRHLYAIGRNEVAARYSGVNVNRCKAAAYLLSALLACLTGILYAPYLESVQANFGTGYELYAIAAAVLGGCSLRGGEGPIPGIIVGALLMRLLYNAIALLELSTHAEDAIIGGVILAAALADAFVHRKSAQ